MRAYRRKVLLCATAIIASCVSSGAEARYWRHYGYHWYGRSWSGFSLNGDVRQVEKQLPSTEPGNDPRNEVGDFGAAIEQMIHACDRQVAELKDMPLDAVARIVDPTPNQGEASASIHERLETLSRALDAAASLAAACPKNASAASTLGLSNLEL